MLLRECDCAENPGTPSCEECEQRQVQRSGDGLRPSRVPAGGPLDPGVTSAIDASRGGGRPLERAARQRLEQGLGEPLGDIRVHADAHAAALVRAVSARAFTVGSDLFFAAGAYRPGSRDGDKLITHEVTHAVQQRGAPASGPLSVSAPADAAEVEAEAMASTLQAEASMHSPGEPASGGYHQPGRTAGARRVISGVAVSIARTVDPTSDDYQRGYNDGRAANPAAPGPLSPDALDDYNEGYQKGQAEAGAAQASLPPAAPDTTGSPAQNPAPAPIPAPGPTDSAPVAPLQPNVGSDDYNVGYRDATIGSGEPSPADRSGQALADYNAGFSAGLSAAQSANQQNNSAPPAGPSAPAGPLSPNVSSDDRNAGYQDGLACNPSAPGSRAGDALEDYNQGYLQGSSEAEQNKTCSSPNATPDQSARPPQPDDQSESVAGMDLPTRLLTSIKKSGKYLPADLVDQLNELTSPTAVAMMLAFIGAQGLGFGEAADAVGFGLLLAKIGKDAFQVAADLKDFAVLTVDASGKKDLDDAGRHLAYAIILIGIDALLVYLAAKKSKGEQEEEDQDEDQDQDEPVPTVRPRLSATQLRQLKGEWRDWVVWRGRDLDVVQNQAIRPTGATNPMVTDQVSFVEGLEGIDYGPNFMAIRKADVPGIYQPPGIAPEWRAPGEIPQDKGFWYTEDDFYEAFPERAK